MRYVTTEQLCAALSCTRQNLYQREGKTIPRPVYVRVDGADVRAYELSDLLWAVGSSERDVICLGLGIDAARLRVGWAAVCAVQAGRVASARMRVPDEDDEDRPDPLLA